MDATGLRGEKGPRRNDVANRTGRAVAAELGRVRETALLVGADRLPTAGALPLVLAVGLNLWGLLRYADRYLLMWVVASLYSYMFYWLLPLFYGIGLALLQRRRERGSEQPNRVDRAVTLLAETRLYRVQPVRLFGLFTLFLLGSDYLALPSLRDVRRMDVRLAIPGRGKK